MTILILIIAVLTFISLAFFRASIASWALVVLLTVFAVFVETSISDDMLLIIGGIVGGVFVVMVFPVLRRKLISTPLLNYFRRQLPEKWIPQPQSVPKNTWDQALFNGQPDWNAWLSLPKNNLSDAEQQFLGQSVEQLRVLIAEGEGLSPKAQAFMAERGFFSLGIATEEGGLGFSAQAQSAIACKVASHLRSTVSPLMDHTTDLMRTARCVGEMKHAISLTFQQVQRDIPIGCEHPLARMIALDYLIESAQKMTALAQDHGAASDTMFAIMGHYASDFARRVQHDAVNILHNDEPVHPLAAIYTQPPIRGGFIFRQGLLSAHAYAAKELSAAQHQNRQLAQLKFDAAFREHVRFVLSHMARSWVFGLTGGFGMIVPGGMQTTRYYQRLTRFSAAFALCTDATLAVAGGNAKENEGLFARLGEVLGLLYLCAATLKRFEDENRPKADLPKLEWAIQYALYQIQQTLLGLLHNLPNRLVRIVLRTHVFPLGISLTPPSDALGKKVLESYQAE